MLAPLTSEEKMEILRRFKVDQRERDLRELRLATRRNSRSHTLTYMVTCHSLWADHGEKSASARAPSLEAAVAAAAKAFIVANNRSDWQVEWSAVCTIARKDNSWSLTTAVPISEIDVYTPKRPNR